MVQSNLKQKKTQSKFTVFVCYTKETCEKACILKSILIEKGFKVNLTNDESDMNFISSELKDKIRLSVCFILISTSNFLNSSLINQEIGYAQGKGLRIMFLVSTELKAIFQDVDTKLNVMEFNESDFRQKCVLVANEVSDMVKILDEPIDLEAFLDFYTKSGS